MATLSPGAGTPDELVYLTGSYNRLIVLSITSILIKELSKRLTHEFGKGFAIANLKNFRQFYLTFPDLPKGYTARSQLSWSHYRLIMRVDNQFASESYLQGKR